MADKRAVRVVEVAPRDGLQNEKGQISTESKLRLISLLAGAGFSRIEATAFVSPRWVPQMADHDEVMRRAVRRPSLALMALAPNERGAAAAIEAGAQALAVFASASETFARKNTNCTIAESIVRFEPAVSLAKRHGLPVRGYVSCAVDCPYEGSIDPQAVRAVSTRLLEIGCDEIAVADTIGRGTPERVEAMLEETLEAAPVGLIACHFHDTSGWALANVDVALALGVRTFDSAVAGLGGCPYAPGAAGNLATGRLIEHLEANGYSHGVDKRILSEAELFARAVRR